MFENIILRRSERGGPITAGKIAESLLYYQNVHLVIDHGTLMYLIRQLGAQYFLNLLRMKLFSAVYCEENIGTHTTRYNGTEFHSFVCFKFYGDKNNEKISSEEDRLFYRLHRAGFNKKMAKNFSKSFLKIVPLRNLSGNYFSDKKIIELMKNDFYDKDFTKIAIKKILLNFPCKYDIGDNFTFDIVDTDAGFMVLTDINVDEFNKLMPDNEKVTIAHLIDRVSSSRLDMTIASFYGGDFATDKINSELIQARSNFILKRSGINSDEICTFIKVTIPDAPCIKEVIDTGKKSFDDFLKLLSRSKKFKIWLNGVNPDEGLVRSYMNDISSESWAQKIPSKTIRYSICSIAGINNPLLGLLSSFVDSFLVEKIFNGWRPNHFVSKDLTTFVKN